MKKSFSISVILTINIVMGLTSCKQNEEKYFEYQNPITKGIDANGLRDCQVLRDGDYWYMTGTSYPHWPRQENDTILNKGVALYKSENLTSWEFVKYIIDRPSPNKWYYKRFWAPEIQKINGKYYTLFNCSNPDMGFEGQHVGYAVSDHIEGPYTVVTEKQPLTKGNDLTFFQDDDQSVYAFWNRGREFGIGFAKIDMETGTFLSEPTTAITPAAVDYSYNSDNELEYETNYQGRPIPKVAKYHDWDAIGIEGAYVIKNEDTYYLFYSSWTRGYEIGYATAPSVEGPWTKHRNNPFYGAMNKNTCEKNGFKWDGDPDSPFNQVGHNEIFIGPDGRFWLSCHGITNEDSTPYLVIDPIWFDSDGDIKSNGPTYTKQRVKLQDTR